MRFNFIKRAAFFAGFLMIVSGGFAGEKLNVSELKLKNGIPVYLYKDNSSKFKTISINLNGGINYYQKEQSGIEDAVFSMMSYGSKKYSYEMLQQFFYRTSTSIGSSTDRKGTVYYLKAIEYYFDEALDVYMDCFLNPTFYQKDVDKILNIYRQNIQNLLNDPSSLLIYNSNMLLYEGHPYSVRTSVLPESIDYITLENLKKFYASMIDSRRIAVVAAGDFDESELVSKLNATLGNVKALKTPLKSMEIKPIHVKGEPLTFVHPSAAGAGIVIRKYSGPSAESEDFYPLSLAMDIYSDILFNVVRETYGDCYTPRAFLTCDDIGFAGEILINVSNIKDFAKHVEMSKNLMAQGKVISGKDEKGDFIYESIPDVLNRYINIFINSKFSSQKTIMNFNLRIANSLLNYNDVNKADELFERVKSVTPEQVAEAFDKYIVKGDYQWFSVVGIEEESEIKYE